MSKQSQASKALCKAVREAGRKLKIKPERQLEAMLDGAGFSLADAYRCGAEEAQDEVVRRLSVLSDAAWQKCDPDPLPTSQEKATAPATDVVYMACDRHRQRTFTMTISQPTVMRPTVCPGCEAEKSQQNGTAPHG